MSQVQLLCGDALEVLKTLPGESVRCCVTSPPYWGLRDYGVRGQLGLEKSPDEYVAKLVAVFREVRRAMTKDATLWLNLGDSYAGSRGGPNGDSTTGRHEVLIRGKRGGSRWGYGDNAAPGCKAKDLVGIPWMVAFALRADGWYLRSDIIWAKPNPMPESVTDRPTKAHEYLFLLSKESRYYYDADAIAEDCSSAYDPANAKQPDGWDTGAGGHGSFHRNGREKGTTGNQARGSYRGSSFNRGKSAVNGNGRNQPDDQREDAIGAKPTRNVRTVWEISTQPYPQAHFATFPEELARRCILAGSAPGDTVLDPFSGSGTVGQVASGNGRKAIGIELNPAYIELARQRIGPMLVVEHDPIPSLPRAAGEEPK